MRPTIMLLLSAFALCYTTILHAESLINCGNGGSASLGDLKHQVRLACGEPERTEVIGYIDKVQNEERIRVMKIEEWIYSTSFYGQHYFYSLVFEGNELVEIKKVGGKNQ